MRGNWPRTSATPEQERQRIEARAALLAREWREDCHVYLLKGNDRGIIEYHPGPDPERPRTKADLVVPCPDPVGERRRR